MKVTVPLLYNMGNSAPPNELREKWQQRGFDLLTEREVDTSQRQLNGLFIQDDVSLDQLSARIAGWMPKIEQMPLLILLVGDQCLHGVADQIQMKFGAHAVDVVRLFQFADQQHAVIGGESSSKWVSTLRRQLAEEEITSLICQRIEVDEVVACLPLYLEWKHRFYTYVGERCDLVDARLDVVAWALGMDKRIGQRWLEEDLPHSSQIVPMETKGWIKREVKQLDRFTNIQTVVIWANELALEQIYPSIQRLGHIHVYLTQDKQKPKDNLSRMHCFNSPVDSLRDADLLIILDVNQAVREVPPEVFVEAMKQPVILDACSCYPLQEMQAFQIAYRTIGQKTNVWNGTAYNRV